MKKSVNSGTEEKTRFICSNEHYSRVAKGETNQVIGKYKFQPRAGQLVEITTENTGEEQHRPFITVRAESVSLVFNPGPQGMRSYLIRFARV